MDIHQLNNQLQNFGISEDKYYLNGIYGSTNDSDKVAMIIKSKEGFVIYEIYYKEKGEKHSIRTYSDEDDACKFFYNKLKTNKELEDRYSR